MLDFFFLQRSGSLSLSLFLFSFFSASPLLSHLAPHLASPSLEGSLLVTRSTPPPAKTRR